MMTGLQSNVSKFLLTLEKISPCLGVHPKQPGQPLVELELKGERKSI